MHFAQKKELSEKLLIFFPENSHGKWKQTKLSLESSFLLAVCRYLYSANLNERLTVFFGKRLNFKKFSEHFQHKNV